MSYTVQITWGVDGPIGIQPIVFLKLPEDVEASWGGGHRALLEVLEGAVCNVEKIKPRGDR